MQLSISIVLFKTDSEDLLNIFDCIKGSGIDYHLYLVDNSPDNSLKNVIQDDAVTYIHSKKNIGYGKGHNLVLKRVLNASRYHLVLNSDITFSSDILSKLISYMNSQSEVGLLMPKILSQDGDIQYLSRLIPTPLDLIIRMALPRWVYKSKREKYQLEFTNYNSVIEAPFLSGCFMFLRTGALKKIGNFDDRFFMYTEDVDLSRRIHEKYKTIYYPEVDIIHKHAKESFKNLKMMFNHVSSAIKYFNKWGWFFDKKRRETNKRILNQLNYKG